MKRLGIILIAVGVAHPALAKIGARDRYGYVGMDSVATPGPALPASFLVPSPSPAASLPVNGSPLQDDQTYEISGFTGQIYGTTVTDCFVHTNGVINCSNHPPAYFDNRPLPDLRWNSDGGTVMIAPFWDDLAVVPGVSTLTFGLSNDGNSLVVQWTDFARYADPTARLTFRAEIQLNSAAPHGYVLFQYLKMQGTGADGSSATIGIQAPDAITFNQYSYNMAGAVKTGDGGGTALQAILFDYDQDGDRLPGRLEAVIGTSDSFRDSDHSDSGHKLGRDDGAELAAGLDPTNPADDGACDGSGDGDSICVADEAFYNTDPNKTDTDGDGIDDDIELFSDNSAGDRTFPDKADSDGDGANDKTELDNGTDPRNPGDIPTAALSTDGEQHRPQAVVDSDGNIHVVADNDDEGVTTGLNYWMLDSTGKVIIPQTFIKAPSQASDNQAQRPVVRAFGGKVYIVYELRHFNSNSSDVGFIRLNPAAVAGMVPDAGIQPGQIIEVNTATSLPGTQLHHQNIAVGPSGVHLVYYIITNNCEEEGPRFSNAFRTGFGYDHLDLDGNLVGAPLTMMTFPSSSEGDMSGPGGVDKQAEARVVVDDAGVAHIIAALSTRPRTVNGESSCGSLCNHQSGLYYAAVSGGTMTGPFYLASGELDRHDIYYRDGLIFVSAGGAHYKGSDVRLGVFDPTRLVVMPRDLDYYGVSAAIDPASMRMPMTTLWVDADGVAGSSLTVTANGLVLMYYMHSGDSSEGACIVAASSAGSLLAPPRCILDGQVYYTTNKSANVLVLSGGFAGLVYDDSGATGDLHFVRIPMSLIADTTGLPPINHPPTITSTAPNASIYSDVAFTYAATATDPDSGQTLTWSLSNAPAGMTVDATGNVTWTPTDNDAGPWDPVLTVCDNGQPSLCDSQSFHVDVAFNTPPKITSMPSTEATVGVPWQYQVNAVDPDGDAISYSLLLPSPAPGNMAMNATGLLTWTPTDMDVGTLSLVVMATDSSGLSDFQPFNIEVVAAGSSHAPRFTSTPIAEAQEGKSYAYQAVAVDDDNPAATFTYTLKSTASGNMSLSTDGALSWTPKSSERGVVSVVIEAKEDDGELATQSFSVIVAPVVSSGSGGCGCHVGGSEPASNGWLAMAMAALFIVMRRRLRA